MKNKKSILICIPSFDTKIHLETISSIISIRDILLQNGIGISIMWLRDSLITRARNKLVKQFLDTDHTHLFFIDADISFTPDDFIRVLKPTGNLFIFCSYNLIGKYHELLDDKFDSFNFMAWHKTNPTPKFRKAGFLNSIELIVACWNKGHNWNFGKQNEMHNFIEGPICMGLERLKDPKHPTQKPLYPLKHILNIASNEGDVVLDPFMGVGSSGVASLQLNRKFIGFELDEKYYNASEKRLKQFPGKNDFF